ncbi:hypothetical protein QVD17_16244 [Tagetes erecta]|uniref:Uncharacterized protein n=1 Tax=Tagetes erecta TaxID=13708 RepID=A0AAD8KUN7_TARER|nr:hypothetical protein QVD17_16244 [Tagetes erecta]
MFGHRHYRYLRYEQTIPSPPPQSAPPPQSNTITSEVGHGQMVPSPPPQLVPPASQSSTCCGINRVNININSSR